MDGESTCPRKLQKFFKPFAQVILVHMADLNHHLQLHTEATQWHDSMLRFLFDIVKKLLHAIAMYKSTPKRIYTEIFSRSTFRLKPDTINYFPINLVSYSYKESH